MTLADVVDSFPQLSVAAGATVEPEALAGVSLIVVHEGLVLVRTMVPGSTRRTITCHAGPGALVLPPADDEVLRAIG